LIGAQFELKKTFATTKQGSVFEQKGIINFHITRNTDFKVQFERQTVSNKSQTEILFGIKQFY